MIKKYKWNSNINYKRECAVEMIKQKWKLQTMKEYRNKIFYVFSNPALYIHITERKT